jgi:hypothetical protein
VAAIAGRHTDSAKPAKSFVAESRTAHSIEALGFELRQGFIFDHIADLKGAAADFTVFDVGVTLDREVEDHRNFSSAGRANEELFHGIITHSDFT